MTSEGTSFSVISGFNSRKASIRDAAEREFDQVDRDLGVLDADGFHQRQPRGVGELEPALDGDVGEVMDAQRPGELDLAAGPGRQGIGDAGGQARRIAEVPRQDRKAGKEKGNEAEQKPFPRDLARLHAVPTHPFRRKPMQAWAPPVFDCPLDPAFLARLGRDSEPNAGAFCWLIRTGVGPIQGLSAGAPRRFVEAPGRLPTMIPCSSSTGARLTSTMVSAESPASS